MSLVSRIAVFEKISVRRAVVKQIVPAVISQMVVLIYSLADTYFVGLLGDPIQTAAITVSHPPFVLLTVISNLFGIGGASTISRMLGKKEFAKAKQVAATSFWSSIGVSLCFTFLFFLFSVSILTICGANKETVPVAFRYTWWVIIIGGPTTVLNTLLATLLRSEGKATIASIGVSLGGLLNIFLDPFFILPQFLNLSVEGAGIATAISNSIATLFFLIYIFLTRKDSVLSFSGKLLKYANKHLGPILSVGFPSAVQLILTVVAIAAQTKFVSSYSTKAVAALGIVKKIDQLPLYFSIGIANGILPLLAYNYASGNRERQKSAFKFGVLISFSFAMICLICFEFFSPQLVKLFISDTQTVIYGSMFLRIMVLAMPLMSVCYPLIIQFQAMGKTKESLICSVIRKGILDIPFLFLLNAIFPLIGCMWVQPIVDLISLIVAYTLYRKTSIIISPTKSS